MAVTRSFGRRPEDVERDDEGNIVRDVLIEGVNIAGRDITIYAPTSSQLVALGGVSLGGSGGGMDIMRGSLNTVGNLMNQKDAEHVDRAIRQGLLDMDGDDGLEALIEMIIEEVQATFPTKPSSGSSRSRRAAGPTLTAGPRPTRSVRQTSRPTAS